MTAAPASCNLRSDLQVCRLFESVTSKLYLGASCEPLGSPLVALESLLGASWGPLGASWGLLEASWGLLEASWGQKTPKDGPDTAQAANSSYFTGYFWASKAPT